MKKSDKIAYANSITTRWECRKDMYLDVCQKNGIGAELGVQHGDNAQVLYDELSPNKMYLVDRWRGLPNLRGLDGGNKYTKKQNSRFKYVTDRFKKQIKNDVVTIIRATCEDASYSVDDNVLDWVYVDANHKFAAVLLDIQLWLSKVNKNGIIMLHDFTTKISHGGPIEAAMYEMDNSRYECLGKTEEVVETKEMPSAAYRKLW